MLIVDDRRDPTRRLYVAPLEKVRADWHVIEIQGAGHLDCIFRKQFFDEIERWLDISRRK